MQEIYSVKQIAHKLQISERTARRYCNQGKIEAFKVGKNYRITESALKAFIEQNSSHTNSTGIPRSADPAKEE